MECWCSNIGLIVASRWPKHAPELPPVVITACARNYRFCSCWSWLYRFVPWTRQNDDPIQEKGNKVIPKLIGYVVDFLNKFYMFISKLVNFNNVFDDLCDADY